ncbi:hypothetical protein KVR01_007380 [Diaporthe batatas]|uniref:uncharacterized protein n=1 Tax=Diaporthe batatas TaxID=748121 RepID=UPI001D03A0A7|nr:uncharacterized protein KVR01_007380 [Diaporthe batatas]KAG8162902.1 hypothetical protein KVR01_007380 [Diaporthe batatas]
MNSPVILLVVVLKLQSKAFPFALKLDVWKHYLRNRPSYPDSLWREWIEYHEGPLNTVHELGTGCGIGAASFLSNSYAKSEPVKHMILSDPSESNIATARELVRADDYPDTRLSFHQHRGEDSFLDPGSVDMAFACECLHFTDVETAIASIHAGLRPGGTVASVFYGVLNATILDNERADAAWRALGHMHFRRVADENLETIFSRMKPGQVGLGLNFVPLDRELWRDVRRVWVNVPQGQAEWPMEVGPPKEAGVSRRSRIDPEYESFEWRTDTDGWALKGCTAERIKETMASLFLQYGEKDWRSAEWREFEAAMDEGGGTVDFAIPVTMIMARKK